jgi:proteasome accessory factor A
LEAYRARDGLAWDDPKLALLDLQYHDVRPDRSLYERLVRAGKVERLVDEDAVLEAMTEPPGRTRAYFRGTCLSRWADSVVAANWDSIILDVGSDPLRRIPMMEPLKGSRAHVERLFEECATPAALVERLAS